MYPLADRLVAGPALWLSAVTLAAAVLLLARRAPAADRRADVRRGGAAVPVWLLDDAGGVTGRGVVLDRSARGLRLAVDEPHPVGAVLRLAPLDSPPGVPPVAAEVRWCRRGGRRPEVGCRLTGSPVDVVRLFS